MESKRQALAVADALAHGRRSRRQRLAYRFRLYPELEKIPSHDRDAALRDAKWRAIRSWSVVGLACFYLLLFVLWIFSREPGSAWLEAFSAISVSAVSLWAIVFRWRVRRALLRSVWRPRAPSLAERGED